MPIKVSIDQGPEVVLAKILADRVSVISKLTLSKPLQCKTLMEVKQFNKMIQKLIRRKMKMMKRMKIHLIKK